MLPITEHLISKDKYQLKCTYEMPNPQFIVVHNTANDAPAINEINYMQSNSDSTSFHFAVDDTQIILGIPYQETHGIVGMVSTVKGIARVLALRFATPNQGVLNMTWLKRMLLI